MGIVVKRSTVVIESYEEAEDLFNYASFRLRNNPPTKKNPNIRMWLNVRNFALESMIFFMDKE